MKATGIVRRIDDLGRVVIPKEIRRTMRIREGDPLEIYTDKDGEVIFKKYSPMGDFTDFAVQMCDTLHRTTGHITAICDRDTFIALSGGVRRELIDRRVSRDLEHIMEGRQIYRYGAEDARLPAAEGAERYGISMAAPIIAQGDLMGCVLFLFTEGTGILGETEYKLCQTVSSFLGKQMEC